MDIRAIATAGLWTMPTAPALIAPTVISATRFNTVGSAVVKGDAGDMIYCFATNISTKNRELLGSVLATGGNDTMTLNFSNFAINLIFVTLQIAAVNLEFVSENAGLFSDVTDYPFTDFAGFVTLTITNYVRGMTTAEFDVAGLPAGFTSASILITDYDGFYGGQTIVSGHNIITGLHPAPLWRLEGLVVAETSTGELYIASPEIGDFLTALPTIPGIDSINVLIYQMIKNDSIFQALTGADSSDPRVYLDYPPDMIAMDLNHPGYATYSLEGGGEIGRDRTFLTQMPDRKYRIDVYARTKGDCDAIYKAIERVLVYKYYQQTTEERVKAIRPLSPGIPQFLADVRLYHASGLFSVEGIQRLNYT